MREIMSLLHDDKKMTDDEINEMIKCADLDGDGQVTKFIYYLS